MPHMDPPQQSKPLGCQSHTNRKGNITWAWQPLSCQGFLEGLAATSSLQAVPSFWGCCS